MSNGGEMIQVEFHNKATEVFFAFFHAFEREVSAVDRKNREFDFQALKKKYVTSFEQELQSTAQYILRHHKNEKASEETGPLLRHFITDYLHRYVQKINGL